MRVLLKRPSKARRLANSELGQSLVELALVLPVILLLLLGIMEGGRIFSSYLELQNAAREGARHAAVSCTTMLVADEQVPAWATSVLTPWLESRLVSLNPGSLTVELSRMSDADGSEVWVELDLKYSLEVVTPVISDITGNPLNLRSRMVMRGE